MFHSKKLGKEINALHNCALRITFGDKTSSFNELLEKDNLVSINHKNLQAQAKEMHKVFHNNSPTIFNIFLHQGLPLITCAT